MGVVLVVFLFLAALFAAGFGVAVGGLIMLALQKRTDSAWTLAAIPLTALLFLGLGVGLVWALFCSPPAR